MLSPEDQTAALNAHNGWRERYNSPRMPSSRINRFAAAAGSALIAFYVFEAAKYKRAAAKGFDLIDPPVPGTPEFGRFSEALTGTPVRERNRIQVLRNGDEIFPSMLKAIKGAQKNRHFQDLPVLERKYRRAVC